MKRILFSLFIIISLKSNSQPEVPFPQTNGSWYGLVSGIDGGTTHWASGFYIEVQNDTVIDGMTYKKVNEGFYRIDSLKVYYRDANPLQGYVHTCFQDSSEILLYDFGLQIGDTFRLCNIYGTGNDTAFIVLSSIDTVNYNSFQVRRFNFNPFFYYPNGYYFWIEGVGSEIGFFPFYFFFESGRFLYCFYQNGIEYSSYSFPNSCDYVGMEELNKDVGFSIFPNPSSDFFNLKFSNPGSKNVFIYDCTGRIVYRKICSGFSESINHQLSNGLYFVTVEDGERMSTQKLVVDR